MTEDRDSEYATTPPRVYTEEEAQARVVKALAIDGIGVDIVAHVRVKQDHIDDAPTFHAGKYEAVETGTYTLAPASRSFYVNASKYRAAGASYGGGYTNVIPNDGHRRADVALSQSATLAGAVSAARKTLATRALFATFGPEAVAATRTYSSDQWCALPIATDPKPHDLVAAYAFGQTRRCVVVKAGPVQVHLMYATPTGGTPMQCKVARTFVRDAS